MSHNLRDFVADVRMLQHFCKKRNTAVFTAWTFLVPWSIKKYLFLLNWPPKMWFKIKVFLFTSQGRTSKSYTNVRPDFFVTALIVHWIMSLVLPSLKPLTNMKRKKKLLLKNCFSPFFALIKEGVPLFQIPSRLSSMYINLT